MSRRQNGEILVMALVLLAAAVVVVVPALFAAQISLGVNRDVEKDSRGYYAAEAGVTDALWKFETPGNAPFSPASTAGQNYLLPGTINGMNVQVTLLKYAKTNGVENYFIQSTALSGSTIQAKIIATVSQAGYNVFNQSVVSLNGDISMSGSAQIGSDDTSVSRGDAYANGNITASKNGTTINGNASATGTISNKITVSGTPTPGATTLTIPPVDVASYKLKAQQGQTVSSFSKSSGTWNLGGPGNPGYITGDLTLTGTAVANITGTIYVGGTINVGNGATVKGGNTVVSNGDITLGGGASAQLPKGTTPLVISVNGNVTVSNGAKLSAIVYAPNGAISLTGSAILWGATVGKSVSLANSAQVIYETGVRGWNQLPGYPNLTGYDYR